MKSLLKNEFAPATFTCGFVERRFVEFSPAFAKWQNELDAKFGTQTELCSFRAPLSEALVRLDPLTTPLDRYLLVETRSAWSAVFANGLRGNDVFSPVSYLPTVLKCRGLEVVCVPDRSDMSAKDALRVYGAIVFALYGPEKTDWLNRIRRVAVTNDVDGWEFAAEGEIQPYEQTENYQKRRVVDRFSVEMLESYCAALGIRLFDPNFYGGQCLVSHTKRAAPPGPTMSISEARSHLYL
jgi:hypothetical protein